MDYQHVKKAPWGQEQYITEYDRDIHIWCGEVGMSSVWSQRGETGSFGLVGGCCTQEGLTASIIYNFITMVIDDDLSDSEPIVLVPASDPRKVPAGNLVQLFESYGYVEKEVKKDDELMPAGHYFLYKPFARQTRQNSSKLALYWPALLIMPKKSKNVAKDNSRSVKTKEETILRDQGCPFTRDRFLWHPAGPNNAGYPVAHIYPMFCIDKREYKEIVPSGSPIKHLISNREAADRAYNTMVMRADVHALYDDYQFSVWVKGTEEPSYFIIRFEKSGAPGLKGISTINLHLKDGVQKIDPNQNIEPINPDFFLEHTRLCLLRCFCGAGRVRLASKMLRKYPDI